MSFDDLLIGIVIPTGLSLLAAIVLGTVFALRHREHPRRWRPVIYVIALLIVASWPDPGWSDVRSHWIGAVLTLAWCMWMICFAIRPGYWGDGPLLRTLRIAFTMAGAGEAMLCVAALAESWTFFHR